jgi:hypothetical protein
MTSVERNAGVSTNVLPAMRLASPVPLAVIALLAACSSQQDEVLAAVKGAHSVTAEWAATERLAARSQVTETYRREIGDMARGQLESDRRVLENPNDPAARAIDAVRRDPAPSAASLAAAAQALDKAEKQLEAR